MQKWAQQAWRLLNAAKNHGEESAADHEVGDLQGVVLACFRVMKPSQRREVLDASSELLKEWGGGA